MMQSGRHRKKYESDNHCWSCHRSEPDIYCPTCVRSFHILCSGAKKLTENEMETWRCSECIDIEIGAEQVIQGNVDLKKVLNFMYKLITSLDEPMTKPFMNVHYAKGKAVNTMDFNTIGKKIELGAYSCCEDFWSDIKWIVHNTKVHRPDEYDAVKAAKYVFDLAKEEMYCFQMCHDCYTNSINCIDDWCAMPCKTPHIIVWAKQRTYPHWPAKVIRYNSKNSTVDIRYFGDGNLRAIVPAKDCLLYSLQNPSISIGKHKKTLGEAVMETEHYINRLKKKYGSFNYAEPLSFLFGNMLERHLFDMIPGAWRKLGKSIEPPPIQKPIPSSATVSRRMSLPVQRTKRVFAADPLSVFQPGRIMTRRMTLILDGLESKKEPPEEPTQTKKNATAYRRQSIQCNRLLMSTLHSTSFTTVTKDSRELLLTSSKKRKMSVDVKDAPPAKNVKIQSTSIPSEDSVFKVPPLPKPLKQSPNGSPCKLKPSINGNVRAMNERPPPKISSKSCSLGKNAPTNPISASMTEHAPNIVAMCEAVVEKNTSKMSESVRMSLADTLFNFLDTKKPEKQIGLLREQFDTQQRNNNQMINELRDQNRDFEAQLKKCSSLYTEKDRCYDGSNEVIALKEKIDKLNDELTKLQVKNNDLSGSLSSLATKSAYLSSTVNKLQATNIGLANSLKNAEAKNHRTVCVNKNLTESNIKMTTKLDNLTVENQALTKRLKGMENSCEAVKDAAFEQCARLITETKKKQWCASCGMPGGRYFCNSQCEQFY